MSDFIDAAGVLLAATGVIATLFHNNNIARKRATIDLVLHQRADEELSSSKKSLHKLHEQDNGLGQWAARGKEETPEHIAIMRVLNNYEFIATGIKEGAFDKKIYQRMQHSMTVRDYCALKGFISDIRQRHNNDKIFQEFEWLAKEFDAKPLKKNT